jgi:RNA polymerase sigma factor for flagellar operon FliA
MDAADNAQTDKAPSERVEPPDPTSREDAVKRFGGLVRAVASRMASRMPGHVDVDDLISTGMIGLIDAYDRFDRTRAISFRKYAIVRIKGAMLDEVRHNDTMSRTFRKRANEVGRATHALERELGRAPTDDEVAQAVGLDPDGFRAMKLSLQQVFTVSSDELSETGRELSNWLYEGAPVDPYASLEGKRVRAFLEEQIGDLMQSKERLGLVLRFHFFDGLTLREIGKILGVTESRASQLLSEAMEVFTKRVKAALRRAPAGLATVDAL